MPGKEQLKQFNEDLMKVGDEAKIRGERGELPSVYKIPDDIPDLNDGDDFALGMPDGAGGEPLPDTPPDGELDVGIPSIDELIGGSGDAPDLSEFEGAPEAGPEPAAFGSPSPDAEGAASPLADAPAEDEPLTPFDGEEFQMPDIDSLIGDLPPTGGVPQEGAPAGADSLGGLDDNFGADQIAPQEPAPEAQGGEFEISDTADIVDAPAEGEAPDEGPAQETAPDMDMSSAFDDFDKVQGSVNMNEGLPDELNEGAGQGGATAMEGTAPAAESSPSAEEEPFSMADLDLPDFDAPAPSADDTLADIDAPSPSSADALPDFDAPASGADETLVGEGGLDMDKLLDDVGSPSGEQDSGGADVPVEAFDGPPDLDGMSFDAPSGDAAPQEFDMGSYDAPSPAADFDPDSFEIPGFSGADANPFDKFGKVKAPAAAAPAPGAAAPERPKNSLTDEEYKAFQKNLAEYPLNVRIALEDFVVRDEFTDDAIFEVIEKVRDRVPVRQVATHLEKMMDISLSIPRDFERRTASQYEAYKRSFEYQLKNRIIPGGLAIAAAVLVCFGLFQFARAFIYRPAMAHILYSRGYGLLEQNEYPQAEINFNKAVGYRASKKWFFKYARGYREHKQYARAADMYNNILVVFRHDLEAGLEYAEMELYDRENYERAEEIVRREILDYHINSPEGLLMLGDVYLQWATERDSGKFEEARKQYAELVELYGKKSSKNMDLYMSRLMRYFVRTDNLREVLNMKNFFYSNDGKPRKKAMGAEDWTEMSGYLLEKEYSQLKPSEEFLRSSIEDVRAMLLLALELDPSSPLAHYNLARYNVLTENGSAARSELALTIRAFEGCKTLRRPELLKYINSYRMLGEEYVKIPGSPEHIKAQEQYGKGIEIFERLNKSSGFMGDRNVGKLYADMADLDYFVSADRDMALRYYQESIRWNNDVPPVRYKVGCIQYGKGDFDGALGSFIATADKLPHDTHVLLALSNTLAHRGDNHAASGYYDNLLRELEVARSRYGAMIPQVRDDHHDIVDLYMKASNNFGVVLYRIARQTGDSNLNARSMVMFAESARAWDALTRNQDTMVRSEDGNLAAQNTKYITNPASVFEPGFYTEIPRILDEEKPLF